MGTSEHVIERLNQYNCNAGIVDINQNQKSGWNEFKTQIQMLDCCLLYTSPSPRDQA